jgi:hypothetical protein
VVKMGRIKIKLVDVRNGLIDYIENFDELIDCLDDYVENGVREIMVIVQ